MILDFLVMNVPLNATVPTKSLATTLQALARPQDVFPDGKDSLVTQPVIMAIMRPTVYKRAAVTANMETYSVIKPTEGACWDVRLDIQEKSVIKTVMLVIMDKTVHRLADTVEMAVINVTKSTENAYRAVKMVILDHCVMKNVQLRNMAIIAANHVILV